MRFSQEHIDILDQVDPFLDFECIDSLRGQAQSNAVIHILETDTYLRGDQQVCVPYDLVGDWIEVSEVHEEHTEWSDLRESDKWFRAEYTDVVVKKWAISPDTPQSAAGEPTYTVSYKKAHIETREVWDGDSLLLQGRTNIEDLDGSMSYGNWITTSSIVMGSAPAKPKKGFWCRVRMFLWGDSARTHCKCCGNKLHIRGGINVPFAGAGFCPTCAGLLRS